MGLRNVGRRIFGRKPVAGAFDWAVDGGDLGTGPRAARVPSGQRNRSRTKTLDGRIPAAAPRSGNFYNSPPMYDNSTKPRLGGRIASDAQRAAAGKAASAGVVAPRGKHWYRPRNLMLGAAGITAATSAVSLKRNTGPGAIGNGYRPVGSSSGGGF